MAVSGFDDRNVIGIFQSQNEERFEGSWAQSLSFYNPNSDRATESYGIFGGYPKMREWIGARQANTVNKKQYEVRNKPYESTLVVPQTLLNRDKSGMLTSYIGGFAEGVVINQWEDLLIDLINTNGNGFDAQPFFSASHSFGDSGTQKNLVTSSDVPALDVTTATAPTPTEMANVILGLTAHLLTLKDDKASYLNGNARKFVVVVATVPLFSAAVQAINGNMLTGNVDSPLTGMKLGGFSYEVKMIPGLTSATDKVFVFRTDGAFKPFILQEEQGIEYEYLGLGTEFYFENHAVKLGVNTSRGAGYGWWPHAIRGTLS